MTRLESIACSQKKARLRDALFACLVAVAATLAISAVTTAVSAAAPITLAKH